MTVSNVGGNTRYRKHQVGTQSALLTPVAATRVLPYRGAITVNPNRTDPDVDTGSIDPALPPTLGALEIASTWEGKLAYNDLPCLFLYGAKGGVSPSGPIAKTWSFQVASLSADAFDVFTDEWGDDQSASDGIQAYGGLIDSFTLSFGEDLAAWDVSTQNVYAGANLAVDRTGALTVDSNPTWVMGGETLFYNDTVPGSIGVSPWLSAVHGVSISWANNLDKKRFANGSNNHIKLGGYGRGLRAIEIQVTTAKTAATMAERATLDDTVTPVKRYLEIRATSPTIITGATPYSASFKFPARLYEVTDGEIGGNATLIFTYHAFYDTTLTYAAKVDLVTTLAAAP